MVQLTVGPSVASLIMPPAPIRSATVVVSGAPGETLSVAALGAGAPLGNTRNAPAPLAADTVTCRSRPCAAPIGTPATPWAASATLVVDTLTGDAVSGAGSEVT
jgi:hypothetical protein